MRRALLIATLAIGLAARAAGDQGRPQLDVTLASRAMQPGEVVIVRVACDCGGAAPVATAFGAAVPLASEGRGWMGLLGIDVDVRPASYRLVVSVPGTAAIAPRTLELPVVNKSFRTRRLRVDDAFVTPPASVEARIARDAAALQAIFKTQSPRAWEGPFVAPVAPVAAAPSSSFGTRSFFNGVPRQPHGGTDFSSRTGTPVVAPGAGRVALADDLYFTGNTVVVDHGAGIFSLMAHLSAITVKEGEPVPRGATLGRVGATGRVTGPHLHWAVRLHGARVDPLSLLAMTAAAR